jgi:hypothetical protein
VSRPALGPTQPPVQWVPGVLSPGIKRGRGVMLTTHPHLVPGWRISRGYTSSPPQAPPWRVGGQLCFLQQTHDVIKSSPVYTERRGRLVSTPASYSGGKGFKSRLVDRLLTKVSRGFPQSLLTTTSSFHNLSNS